MMSSEQHRHLQKEMYKLCHCGNSFDAAVVLVIVIYISYIQIERLTVIRRNRNEMLVTM